AGRSYVEKPVLPTRRRCGEIPPPDARKGEREVYWRGGFLTAQVWDMEKILPGNVVGGLAIIEAPSTTVVVPTDSIVELDEHMILHLRTRQQ
ncbi:MAG: hydantoinase/oxoprolinase family protein, partial [Candidatus Binatia bacterium]